MEVHHRKRAEKGPRKFETEDVGRKIERKRGRKPKMKILEDDDDFRKGRFSETELEINLDDMEFEIRDWDE